MFMFIQKDMSEIQITEISVMTSGKFFSKISVQNIVTFFYYVEFLLVRFTKFEAQ